MAIELTGTVKPKGNFPIAVSEDVILSDGTRLSEQPIVKVTLELPEDAAEHPNILYIIVDSLSDRQIKQIFLGSLEVQELWLGGNTVYSSNRVYLKGNNVATADALVELMMASANLVVISSESDMTSVIEHSTYEAKQLKTMSVTGSVSEVNGIIQEYTLIAVTVGIDSEALFENVVNVLSAISQTPTVNSVGSVPDTTKHISAVGQIVTADGIGSMPDTTKDISAQSQLNSINAIAIGGHTIIYISAEAVFNQISSEAFAEHLVNGGTGQAVYTSLNSETQTSGDVIMGGLNSKLVVSTSEGALTSDINEVYAEPSFTESEGESVAESEISMVLLSADWEYPIEEDEDTLIITQVYLATPSSDYLEVM